LSVDSKKRGLDAAGRQQLAVTIKVLSKLHEDRTGQAPTTEQLLATLRERGQDAQADELERLVQRVRAKRSGD